MLNKVRRYISEIKKTHQRVKAIENILDLQALKKVSHFKEDKVLIGKMLANLNNNKEVKSINEVEFQVFSQWGEDGIIQYLINKINIPNKTFIEFGVENYTESNTRFLLINNNWTGLVIDGSEENVDSIKNDPVSWAFDLYSMAKFITSENINEVLLLSNFDKEVGIFSIDIDGNDYWVWKEMSVLEPVIVISEYNSLFGSKNPWTIPYKNNWERPHYSDPKRLFYGSSLLSLCDLAEEKGYYFVGCNSNGNNAFFVRKDKVGSLKPLRAEDGFVESKFREVLLSSGRLSGAKRFQLGIKGQTVYNTRTNKLEVA